MTQLFIAGVEVVLPKEFSTAVKRENSFFTKNGEYTYDVTVNLDNPINKALWTQWRLNNSKEEKSKRTAVLIADNRVYCNGTEVITGWTNNTVSIQIVSGNSELNYFIGQDLEIAYLTEMGEVDEATAVSATMKTVNGKTEAVVYPDIDYCLPPMYNETKGILINSWTLKVAAPVLTTESNIRVQPYVLAVIRRLINALGYTITTNQLENSDFRYMIFANFVKTKKYNEMFPGWTAKALLEEIENLLNVVFVINQESRECQIYIKTSYYVNTQQFSIKNVIDEYEVEVDEDGVDERSISNIRYTLPSSDYYSMAKLNKKVKAGVKTINCDSLSAVRTAIASSTSTDRNIYKDTSTGRLYIKYGDFVKYNTMEVNQLADLIHDDTTDDAIEIKLAPAPLVYVSIPADITTDRSSITGVSVYIPSVPDTTDDSDDGATTTDDTTTETLTEYITSTKEDSTTSECQLYIAFFNGFHKISTLTYDLDIPAIYTDSYHAQTCGTFAGMDGNTFVGSLRLEDIDNELYDGAYMIDTKHGVTIESFDPNKYDVRNIFIIGNKRYVCSTIEETILAKGRQKKWKGTFYPITLSDTAANSRWVLNDGNWDDGGVWIDDGKWID